MRVSTRRVKKALLSDTFKNIITIIIVACLFFVIGWLWPTSEEENKITSDLLASQIEDISELATIEYNYTNMGKFENTSTFYGYEIPFTTKSFIVSYDGIIKAGIDMNEVSIKVSRRIITVTVPEAEILSHEIDEDSLQIFDESSNIFNQITIEDYNTFSADQKETMEEKVIEKGLLSEAQDKAETVITNFITSINSLDDDWTIKFVVNEE